MYVNKRNVDHFNSIPINVNCAWNRPTSKVIHKNEMPNTIRRDICVTIESRRTGPDPKSVYEPNNSEHCPQNVHVVVIFRTRREHPTCKLTAAKTKHAQLLMLQYLRSNARKLLCKLLEYTFRKLFICICLELNEMP